MGRKPAFTCLLLLIALLTAGAPLSAQSDDTQDVVTRRIEAFLRHLFAWGPEFQVTVGPLREAAIPGLYSVLVRISGNGTQAEQIILVTPDGRYLIQGEFFDTRIDPFAQVRDALNTAGHPSKGPADAPVTIVEYGDFQCPTCAAMYPILKSLLSDQNNVRLVYKDFPLTDIHDWALRAAIAAQCAYQQSPYSFWRLHDYLFENQEQLNTQNLDARLDALAPRARLNLHQFRTCRTQELTRPRVEQSIREGTRLGVANTPTLFLNGRPLSGSQSPQTLQRLLTFELRIRQQGTTLR